MGIRWSHITALAIVGAVGVWMGTGNLVIGGQSDTGSDAEAPATRLARADNEPFRVRVATFTAGERRAELEIRGRTEAEARLAVRAETAGLVVERPVTEGDIVKKGDLLCRIDTAAREARVMQARAQLAQTQLDYEAASELIKKGFTAETKLRALKATHDAAAAAVTEAEVELSRTRITSPSDGIVETPLIEIGETLSTGSVCATVLNADPMLITGQVSERDVGALSLGMDAHVELVDGQTADGKIRFISHSADAQTRTFRVEIEIDNANGLLRDGVTASAFVTLPPTKAHVLSSSLLVLADDGSVGVRSIDDSNAVKFFPVTILGNTDEGTWVAGLPDTVTLITVGQDYVAEGEIVAPVAADDAKAAASAPKAKETRS
ncbi:MAG: efflux RND transporter periplasmic adaptor subunit [Hyphomicrobiales bacterium]|nr:MAG: efflux RND transporter periplasmic adaptor subunit [Hyphomicrobiales bacterium]